MLSFISVDSYLVEFLGPFKYHKSLMTHYEDVFTLLFSLRIDLEGVKLKFFPGVYKNSFDLMTGTMRRIVLQNSPKRLIH